MEEFEFSELYRKYTIELIINNRSFYTVWGTDMNDNENDKLIVIEKMLVLFPNLRYIKAQINRYDNIFFDKENFENWTLNEPFEEVYTSYDLNVLFNFAESYLLDKQMSLEIIGNLNLLQDFYIQINESEDLFASSELLEFKDILYNGHFWKSDTKMSNEQLQTINFKEVRKIIKQLQNDFLSKLLYV